MWLYVYKEKKENLWFTGKDLAVCSRIRVCFADQHDRRMKILAGQDTLMAGRCLLSGRYTERWKCTILHGNVWACRRNTKALLKEQTYSYYFHPVPFVGQFVWFAFSFKLIFGTFLRKSVKRLPLSTFLFPRFRPSPLRANSIFIKEPGWRSLLGVVQGLPYKSFTILA